eukprot:CAMPEP_0171982100 /NCGR_PEP_ID=MMETSP0993-20121228/269565_1 /TAXON_ID=483369 /ORGANISM="non described non described, Strain CCMP2098" /LENGTH=44 /DNA_ID= /DNA_START= /DNA_END= /DNA_ORIENTATION=
MAKAAPRSNASGGERTPIRSSTEKALGVAAPPLARTSTSRAVAT